MLIPNSSAMDATSACGGPITMLPQIVTGEPEQIWAHVAELVQKAAQFASVMQQFEQASQQLERAWSGGASESAIKKIGDSLQAFEKIIKAVEEGASLLGISAGMVKSAQTAYQSVVSAVNPTVASLMSNPWTYGAAVALSTGTSATLRGFIQTVQGLLTALGVGKLAMQVSTLVSIISEIEQLMHSGTGDTAGNAPPQSTAPPVIAPAPPNVVNPIGSTGATDAGSVPGAGSAVGAGSVPGGAGTPAPAGTAPAPAPVSGGSPTPSAASAAPAGGYPAPAVPAGGYPAPSAGGYPPAAGVGNFPSPTTGGYPMPVAGNFPPPLGAVGSAMPGLSGYPGAVGDPSDGWIPVDPSTPATPDPSDLSGPGGGDDAVLTISDHGTTTTVDVPAGHDLGVQVGSDHHVHVDVDGAAAHDTGAAHDGSGTHGGSGTHHAGAAHHDNAAPQHAAAAHHAPAHHTPAHPVAPDVDDDVVITVTEGDLTTTLHVPATDEVTVDIAGGQVSEHVISHSPAERAS